MTKRVSPVMTRRPVAVAASTSQGDLFATSASCIEASLIHVGNGDYVTSIEYFNMLAFLTFETPLVNAQARGIARNALKAILSAAAAGGFTNGELLETLMAACEKSSRVSTLSYQAVTAVGPVPAFIAVLHQAGLPTEGCQ